MKEQDKTRIKGLLVIGVLSLLAMQAGLLRPLGIEPFVFNPIVPPGADDVYFKVNVKESLGAYADEDVAVYWYDADGEYVDDATASSGVATFSGTSVKEGTHVWLQARPAAPASADGYITPLQEFIVGTGDPTDTVSARNAITDETTIWVDNLHDSAEPHFTFYAPDQANLASGSVDNLTTNDLSFTMNIYIDDDECWYGAPDYTDMVSGDTYIGGIWLLWSGADDYTFEQGSARYYHKWSVGSTIYHAWNFNIRLWQDSLRTGDVSEATCKMTLANGADFDGGSDTITLDIFDQMLYNVDALGNVVWSSSNFVDGGGLAPAAVTAYID